MQRTRVKKSPVLIKTALEKLLKNLGAYQVFLEQKVISNWNKIAGSEMSKLCLPLKIENGILWLSVKNPSWRNELLFIKDKLISRANEFIGRSVLKNIIFTK